jgi:hypothetical protein
VTTYLTWDYSASRKESCYVSLAFPIVRKFMLKMDHISKTMHPRTLSDIELFPVPVCPIDPKGVSCVSKTFCAINDIFYLKTRNIDDSYVKMFWNMLWKIQSAFLRKKMVNEHLFDEVKMFFCWHTFRQLTKFKIKKKKFLSFTVEWVSSAKQ